MMPQRKLEYGKIERGEQATLAGNLSHFAGKQIFCCAQRGFGIMERCIEGSLDFKN
jgi:hypothetical protein